jgi:hypothetical protein
MIRHHDVENRPHIPDKTEAPKTNSATHPISLNVHPPVGDPPCRLAAISGVTITNDVSATAVKLRRSPVTVRAFRRRVGEMVLDQRHHPMPFRTGDTKKLPTRSQTLRFVAREFIERLA